MGGPQELGDSESRADAHRARRHLCRDRGNHAALPKLQAKLLRQFSYKPMAKPNQQLSLKML